jgi:hypothetical protein
METIWATVRASTLMRCWSRSEITETAASGPVCESGSSTSQGRLPVISGYSVKFFRYRTSSEHEFDFFELRPLTTTDEPGVARCVPPSRPLSYSNSRHIQGGQESDREVPTIAGEAASSRLRVVRDEPSLQTGSDTALWGAT